MRWLIKEKRLCHDHSEVKWPNDFFDFSPIEDIPDFKLFREELKDKDPLK